MVALIAFMTFVNLLVVFRVLANLIAMYSKKYFMLAQRKIMNKLKPYLPKKKE
jgi:hypothetical protein